MKSRIAAFFLSLFAVSVNAQTVPYQIYFDIIMDNAESVRSYLANGGSPVGLLHRAGSAPKTVRVLLEAGASVNARDSSGKTPLHEAKKAEVTKLLLEAGANPKIRSRNGFTALHFAWEPEQVKLLVSAGAEVNVAATQDGDQLTPLHIAASMCVQNPLVIEALLNAGASGSAKNSLGETPFARASESCREKNANIYWRLHDAQYQ